MALRKKERKLDSDELWEYALRCLDRRPYASGELRTKLKTRAVTSDAVVTVMNKLMEYGLVDDRKYAEMFALSRLEGQGQGAMRVLRDLRARNIGSRVAEQAVKRTYAEQDEAELVRQYVSRKYRSVNLAEYLQDEKNLAAAYRRLRLQGFGTSTIVKVLKEHTQRASELESMDEREEE